MSTQMEQRHHRSEAFDPEGLVTVGSSPRSFSFTSTSVTLSLHFQDRCGKASFRYRNHTEITVLMCKQIRGPNRYRFRVGAGAIPYNLNITH